MHRLLSFLIFVCWSVGALVSVCLRYTSLLSVWKPRYVRHVSLSTVLIPRKHDSKNSSRSEEHQKDECVVSLGNYYSNSLRVLLNNNNSVSLDLRDHMDMYVRLNVENSLPRQMIC